MLYEEILHCAVLRSEWQGYVFYSRLGIYIIGGFFLKRKDFFSWIAFLSKLSWRNSFVLKRCGEGWRMRGASISITKFTEMWWNDCVFESSEEHRKCSGKVTDIRLAGVEKLFPWWKDSSLRYASFRMTGLCFLLAIRNLYYWGDFFESQRFFFLNCFFKWAKWEFASELRKLCFNIFIMFK